MWYFTWILGLGVAVLFAVVNAMWLELQDDNAWQDDAVPERTVTGSDTGNAVDTL